jgi:hypothetical protein
MVETTHEVLTPHTELPVTVQPSPEGPHGLSPGEEPTEPRPRGSGGRLAIVLAAILALVLGAVVGGLVGYNRGSAAAADAQAQVERLTSENATLSGRLDDAQAAATAAQQQAQACQQAVVIAEQIVANRDAQLEFWFGPNSLNLPEDPNDPVYNEAYQRDQEYRQLVGQLQATAAGCVTDTSAVSPAGTN